MGSEADHHPGGYWTSQLLLCKLGGMCPLCLLTGGVMAKCESFVRSLSPTSSSEHIPSVPFFYLFFKRDPFSNISSESLNAQYCSWHVEMKNKEMRARFGL